MPSVTHKSPIYRLFGNSQEPYISSLWIYSGIFHFLFIAIFWRFMRLLGNIFHLYLPIYSFVRYNLLV